MANDRLRIMVTGTGGFVGQRFVSYSKDKFDLQPVSLREKKPDELDFTGIDAIVHLAGKAHEMKPVPDQVYYDINYSLTRKLAEKAKAEGVPHFIFVSTTKVYGEEITRVLDENSVCNPADAYGKSKYQAEEYLRYIATGIFKIAVVRPPLVYGAGVKGNMIRLLQLADKNYPLPFGKAGNLRSMVYVDNLVELLHNIILKQATGTFLAGDAKPISTDALIGIMRKYLGKKEGLIAIPSVLRSIIKSIKPELHARLFGSYVVDNTSTNQKLDFIPPYSTDYGIGEMVKWYKEGVKNTLSL